MQPARKEHSMDDIKNDREGGEALSEATKSAAPSLDEPRGKTYDEVNVTDCASILNIARARKISAARFVRTAAAISAIIAASAFTVYYVAGDKKAETESGIHPFTQSCIDAKANLKPGITDINCSFEYGRKRVYYTMTEDELAKIIAKVPAKAVTVGCTPFSVEFFIAANESAAAADIEAKLKEAGIQAFCKKDPDGAAYYELNYVDSRNTPHQQISVRLPQ